jgi:hypothetical protein
MIERSAAWWYAAGRQDGADAPNDSAACDRFVRWALEAQRAYSTGQASSLLSVPDLYEDWNNIETTTVHYGWCGIPCTRTNHDLAHGPTTTGERE